YGVPVVGGSNPLAPTRTTRLSHPAARGESWGASDPSTNRIRLPSISHLRYPSGYICYWTPGNVARVSAREVWRTMSSVPEVTTRWRIIIADDESLIRLDLREMLTHLGYEVIGEASDGRTAVELAKRLRPDLLIMDIQMPEVDGIAAAEELTRERIAPVVLLTAFSDQVLVERAREAGVVGYVVKPFREA